MSSDTDAARVFDAWVERELAAESMIPLVGDLYRRRNVVCTIHGRRLIGQSANGILKLHRFARHLDGSELDAIQTLETLRVLSRMDLGPAVIDVASLMKLFSNSDRASLEKFLSVEMVGVLGGGAGAIPPTDVVLYGFGRIGRLVARILLARAGGASGLRIRAIVVRSSGPGDIVKRAGLLRRDSIHGPFDGSIVVDEAAQTITANGTVIDVIEASAPDEVDYEKYGIADAIVLDSTGKWRDYTGLVRHLSARGASRVLLTTAAKGEDVPNIVFGVNDELLEGRSVVAAASCTTNAVAPVLKALHERFGVARGHVETVHAYTNDQNLTDNFHSADRRGRAAGLNMVLTETGAARAVGKAYPALTGKLTGNAIRVPVANVSLAVLALDLEEDVSRDELNAFLRSVSLSSPLRRQVDYVDSPDIASSDHRGARKAGIVDGLATIADGGKSVIVYVWYDNEYGYSRQVVRVLEAMTGRRLPVVP